MQKLLKSIVLLGLMTSQLVAMSQTLLSDSGLIPKPVSVIPAVGTFTLTENCNIYITGESAEMMQVGKYLAGKLGPSTGFAMTVKTSNGNQSAGNIYLSLLANDTLLGDEGYQLTINTDVVNLTANKPEGLFNGI